MRQTWTARDGLPQSSINALAQTADGFLWVGTDGGLARFDGSSFRSFGQEVDSTLPAARVLSLTVARGNELWIGFATQGLWRSSGHGFERMRAPDAGNAPVRALAIDRQGALWVGTDAGALRFAGERWTRFGLADGLPDLRVAALGEDAAGRLWTATGRGAAWFDGESFRPVGPAEPVHALARGEDGAMLALTSGVLAFAREGARPLPAATPSELAALAPTTLLSTSDGALWIGGEGIARLTAGHLRLAPIEAAIVRRPVRALYEDREENLWVGTDGAGLMRLAPGAARTFGRAAGLGVDVPLPVLEGPDGSLWIGGNCGGLWRYRWGGFEEAGFPGGGRFRCVRALLFDRKGALWAAHDGGLARIEPRRERNFGRRDGLPALDVRALLEDRAGTIWAWTTAGPACLRGDHFEPLPLPPDLAGATAEVLFEDSRGAVWAGLESGAAVYRAGTWERLDEASGLAGLPVRDFLEDRSGALWAAVYGGGLARFDGARWKRLGRRDGVPDLFLSRLIDDGEGHLWLTGTRGVHRLTWSDLTEVVAGRRGAISPWTIGAEEGLASAECVGGGFPAGWRGRDGRLWVPTVGGLARIDPVRSIPASEPPVALLEEMRVDGSPREVNGTVWIAPGAEVLELRFTSVLFADRPTLRFRYRLAGFDRDWRDAGGRRSAAYAALAPGSYRFEVQAARGDGPWGASAGLRVELAPFWYERASVRTAAVLLPAFLLATGLATRSRRLRRQRRELARLVEERTRELAAAKRSSDAQVALLARQERELESLNRDLEQRVADQTAQLRETRDMAVFTLARIAELRDGATGEHLERIAAFSRRLAEAMLAAGHSAVDAAFVDQIFRSSPLHDIGKVAIADSILRKAGPLTPEEQLVMQSHTVIGGDTLRRIVERYERHDFLAMGMEIAYGHHERWDGGGYPRRRRGVEIPLAARLVAVVDAYDAITTARPYKPALPHAVALRRLAVDRGSHFDPDLLDLFLQVSNEIGELAARLRTTAHPT